MSVDCRFGSAVFGPVPARQTDTHTYLMERKKRADSVCDPMTSLGLHMTLFPGFSGRDKAVSRKPV